MNSNFISWVAPARDNVWFSYRISVVGKTVRTFIDGRLICEYTEPDDAWRPEDKRQRLLASGTFALQAHDPGSVAQYRKIRVQILPDDLPTPGSPEIDRDLDRLLTGFANSNHALIDIGIETPSLSFSEQQAQMCRQYGLSFMSADLAVAPASLLVVTDRALSPNVELLKAARRMGCQIAFSSGGATGLDRARLKLRLQAMAEAELGWSDLWVPGK